MARIYVLLISSAFLGPMGAVAQQAPQAEFQQIAPDPNFNFDFAGSNSVVPITAASQARPVSDVLPDFNGVWLAAPGQIGGGRAAEMAGAEPPRLTADAKRTQDAYDLLVDDPAYQCDPSSITRAWSNPVPTEIEQQPGRVTFRHEYMDAVRTTYLDGRGHPPGEPPEVLGHSIGRYEGSTLVIESIGFTPSFIGTVSGLPQTPTLRTIERLTLTEDGQGFRLEITHEDPATFTAPWTATRDYVLTDLELLEWNCILEDAGYEEFDDP